MKYILNRTRIGLMLVVSAMLVLASCNKDLEQFTEAAAVPVTGITLGETLSANPDNSLYLALVQRAGLEETINDSAATYTMFVPGNQAMRIFVQAATGGAIPVGTPDAIVSAFLTNTFPQDKANAIVSYNILPQKVMAADISSSFPNLQYPSIFNPEPTLSDLLRLTTFPSTGNGAWINDIPLTNVDITASNGVIHNSAFLVTPPSRFLWDRISTDPNMTYLKAAIIRADSGIVPAPAGGVPNTLQGALESIGANLTILAPTDLAFQTILTGAIYQALIDLGLPPAQALAQAQALASTPDVFSNPLLFGVLTAQTVQGIVVYHILGSRAFTNNFPTTSTLVPTLLNGGIPSHPGVALEATFSVPFVSAATVKGQYNATPANVVINSSPLLPDPYGTSDQHFVNGTIQVIDQVLIPLPL